MLRELSRLFLSEYYVARSSISVDIAHAKGPANLFSPLNLDPVTISRCLDNTI